MPISLRPGLGAITASLLAAALCVSASQAFCGEPPAKAETVSTARIEALVALLSSPSYAERRAAELGLYEIGAVAAPALRKAAAVSPHAARKASRLLRLIEWRIHPSRRDIEVLMEGFESRDLIGRMEAVFQLERLCDGAAMDTAAAISRNDPSPRVREYAAASLRRMLFRLGGGRGDLLTILNTRGCTHLSKDEYEAALKCFEEMLEIDSENSTALYNIACTYSRMKETAKAVDYLEKAVKAGFTDRLHIISDSDLANIRDDPKYKAIVESLK